MVSVMRHVTIFHPEWGCLAPTPSFMRTARTVLVATAVGAVAGGGVVLSVGAHSAADQTSVAERTLVGSFPAVSTSIRASQSSPEKINQRVSKVVSLPDDQVSDPPTNELNARSPARPSVATASAEVRMAAVAPPPTNQMRPKRVVQKARHEKLESSSPPPQHPLPPRRDPDVFQRFWAGLTAAIDHVWPLPTPPAS